MSDETPTTPAKSEPDPEERETGADATTAHEPIDRPADTPEVADVENGPAVEKVTAAAEPVPVTADPASAGVAEPATARNAATATPAAQDHRVVYVEAPAPPRVRGNRVVGTLLALVGAVVFAALFALVAGLLYAMGGDPLFGGRFGAFVASAAFWVPVLVFVLAFILEVVIVNRGGWAAHVFGSLLLAFIVYFASIGLLLLVGNVFSNQHVTFTQIALTPQIIASAVIAREVAIWFGLGIARRGRSVRTRNAEAKESYEREVAEQRARYARPTGASEPTA
ncbi:hypothetical protein [Pseudolysinimonas sp.]|uniref:hypothetical protein n=1 Tax=Pseudolysinimonas sp. TaxID=2680009 RepID=UPI003F7F38B4